MFTAEGLSLHWLGYIICNVKVSIGFAIGIAGSKLVLLSRISQTNRCGI